MCSAGFIAGFKLSNGLSSRKCHYKIRPNVSEEERSALRDRLANLLNSMDPDRILNADQTNWLLFPRGLWRRALKGATSVPIHINGDEKESRSVIATVTASGVKLPLQILAHGKTDDVHLSQDGQVNGDWIDHTERGW
jgi:hypothetical protein